MIMKTIKGYKGFDKNLKCRDFQYEVGKEYQTDEVKICEKGFHFCENPIDVFKYYPPADYNGELNRFAEVEGSGNIDTDNEKTSCTNIKINAEIGINGIISSGIRFILSKVNFKDKSSKDIYYSAATNTGDYSAATNTGDSSAATNTGDRSAATNTGDSSAATNTGYSSVAANTGDYSAATNTGNRSAATNTGYSSVAANTGDRSAATNTGDRSAATNTGNSSVATNTGDRSAATNTGYSSVAANTGDRSAATNTGDSSVAANTGDYSVAANTGDYSTSGVSGKESIAVVTGKDSKAKGMIGSWIVLTERGEFDGNNYPIIGVKAFKVDGEIIKGDTFYKLIKGEAVECK